MNIRCRTLALAMGLASVAASAGAQTTVPLVVSGNEARATIELPGGVAADLTIAFEAVVGLNAAALEVSARLIGPLDTSVLSRLPGLAPPAGFPLLLQIEPPAASALSFGGMVTVSLHTHNLSLNPLAPLSLFSAPLGGTFRDITRFEGIGSYRAGGGGGGFSEFVIVADGRPIGAVVTGKFDSLQATLDQHAGLIATATASDLYARLADARQRYNARDLRGAIAGAKGFSDAVRQASGLAIPDVWRANDSLPNVAGLLRAGADTLAFSLQREASR